MLAYSHASCIASLPIPISHVAHVKKQAVRNLYVSPIYLEENLKC